MSRNKPTNFSEFFVGNGGKGVLHYKILGREKLVCFSWGIRALYITGVVSFEVEKQTWKRLVTRQL